MPNPCPRWASLNSHGPFAVVVQLAVPEDYTELYIPPADGGLPIATVSEAQAALWHALDTAEADTSIRVKEPATPSGPGPERVTTVQVGTELVHRGLPTTDDSLIGRAEPEQIDPPARVRLLRWSAQCWVWAPDPPTADERDYAVIARLWARRLTSVKFNSGLISQVTVANAWLSNAGRWWPLPASYPASEGRSVEILPTRP